MSTNFLTISQNVEVSVNTQLLVGWPDLLQARPYYYFTVSTADLLHFLYHPAGLAFDITDLYK